MPKPSAVQDAEIIRIGFLRSVNRLIEAADDARRFRDELLKQVESPKPEPARTRCRKAGQRGKEAPR